MIQLSEADEVKLAGGKGAALAKMIQAGFRVPDGFVITTAAEIMDESLTDEILAAFDKLGAKKVAVRSSAIAEDGQKDAWAGQFDTFLNVKRDGLLEAIKKCRDSAGSERALAYAKNKGLESGGVAVVVQAMVPAEVAGVAFSVHPVTNNRNQMIIEAVEGLAESLVSGALTPDAYIIDKRSFKIVDSELTKSEPIITEAMLDKLASEISKIEGLYGFPVDVEWAFSKGQLFILQSRPITTLDPEPASDLPDFFGQCVLTLARPASVQRDELVRLTANAVCPVEVASLPLEGNNRAYYFEAEAAKKLLEKCASSVDSETKLKKHLADYQLVKKTATKLCQQFESKPSDYSSNIKAYRIFLSDLSWFLYVGVAVDKIIYPSFKQMIEELYPKHSDKILEIVATPKALQDYQKMRLAICKAALSKLDGHDIGPSLGQIVDDFKHVNEYTFTERLLSVSQIESEVASLTAREAQAEINDIEGSIDSSIQPDQYLRREIKDAELLNQANLVREYALLRTDRIDRAKLLQSRLRASFEAMALDIKNLDGEQWTKSHVANLLDTEIDDFINTHKAPNFKQIEHRLSQKYLYYYTGNQTTISTEPKVVAQARKLIVKPVHGQQNSLISPGTVAYKGVASGPVVKISHTDDLRRVKRGDIMVARVTMPDYTPYMKLAAGFITAQGGITSHTAIVARELKRPCIVGSENCMDVLDEGTIIKLDTINQVVTRQEMSDNKLALPIAPAGVKYALTVPQSVLFADLSLRGSLRPAFKKVDLEYEPEFIAIDAGGAMSWNYNDDEDFNQAVGVDVSAIDAVAKFIDIMQGTASALLDIADSLQTASLSNEGQKLMDGLNKFWDAYEIHSTSLFTFWNVEYLLSGEILKRLHQAGLENDIDNGMARFFVPARANYFVQERTDLAKIAKRYMPNGRKINQKNVPADLSQALKTHADKYGFLLAPFNLGRPPDVGDLVKRLDQKGVSDNVGSKKLPSLDDLSPALRQLAELAREFSYWKTHRLDIFSLADSKINRLYEKLAKHIGISTAQMFFMTRDEICRSYEQKSPVVDGKTLQKRQSAYCLALVDGQINFYVPSQAIDQISSNKSAQAIRGVVASNGVVKGRARVVMRMEDLDNFQKGEVLVTPMTRPEYGVTLDNAVAFVTDEGGILCHAAIISREMSKPCIVGTANATKLLKTGDFVEVDADKGLVRVV